MSRISGILLAVVAISACGPAREASEMSPPVLDTVTVAQARRAADELGADLVTMLTSELKRGGPAAAIAVCADSAQVRTRRHESSGMMVRRVGTRVRNVENTPDSTETAVLEAFARAIAEGRAMPDTAFPTSDPRGRTVTHYLRAIRVQEFCLACHGPTDSISAKVKGMIDTRYPNDRATGYQVGDLRGAISVRVTR